MFALIFCATLVIGMIIAVVDIFVEEANETTTDRVVATYSKFIKRRQARLNA
jgi:hypothetical protein|tara:strand:+ start:374 stop:529 length:156 start_codon:yes stop_codon:yes gene_type:complete